MVAHTPTALPQLSPEDQTLLLRYFAASEDPAALSPLGTRDSAPSTSPPSLLSLYSFLSRPDIAAWVAFHREHQAHLQKQLALNQLAAVCKSSPNPIEQRRAATTLLRGLASPSSSSRPRRTPEPAPDRGPPRTTSPNPLDTDVVTVAPPPVRPMTNQPPSAAGLNSQRILSPHPELTPDPLPGLLLSPRSNLTAPIAHLLAIQGGTTSRTHHPTRTRSSTLSDSS